MYFEKEPLCKCIIDTLLNYSDLYVAHSTPWLMVRLLKTSQ